MFFSNTISLLDRKNSEKQYPSVAGRNPNKKVMNKTIFTPVNKGFTFWSSFSRDTVIRAKINVETIISKRNNNAISMN